MLAERWNPILDVFQECGIKFALEVHPTEIAFDIASAQRALEAVGHHPRFGFNYDPSHLGYQGVDYVKFIRTFARQIHHAHMKDVWWGHGDGTVGVFGGHTDFCDARRAWDFRSVGRGDIRFENVSVHYDGASRPALDGVTLNIAPGETVALVGASGAGKTTLANLVPCFYRPTSGRILLDGHDLATVKLASLRANIALVSQDVVLFNDTVAANIAYGSMNGASESDIAAAADAAHATEFIRQMPKGFATLVGENGVKLSGGQRQRLAIARALLKNAPVLVLDEATSALDSESERHVQAALEVLMRGRTTLVIAHRLSTVENANRIVVLDQGRIVEIGTHRELLERGGIYTKLYRNQFTQHDRVD